MVIPLDPFAPWNDAGARRKVKGEGQADTPTFHENKLELQSNPKNIESVKVGASFMVFEIGIAEQWCRWRDDLQRVWKGLNNTSGPNRASMVPYAGASVNNDSG